MTCLLEVTIRCLNERSVSEMMRTDPECPGGRMKGECKQLAEFSVSSDVLSFSERGSTIPLKKLEMKEFLFC